MRIQKISKCYDKNTVVDNVSFETVLAENPDYIFVMDRDSAIGTEGAQLAQEIMEKELLS